LSRICGKYDTSSVGARSPTASGLIRGALAAAAGAVLILISPPARPHTHADPDGTTVDWYPSDCCSNGDCRPVVSIVSAPRGGLWMTTVDGYTVLVGSKNKRLPSRDRRWHLCINGAAEPPTEPITCVFEPSNS